MTPNQRETAQNLTEERQNLPYQITIPSHDAYQVRIVRDGQEFSACFSWWRFRSKESALEAAVQWRDSMVAALPPALNGKGSFMRQPMPRKTSYGHVGISRYLKSDRRREGRHQYLIFGVNWTDDEGKPRIKQFQAGRAGDISKEREIHTALAAEACRTEWEYCKIIGKPFCASRYAKWSEAVLYPFEPV